MQNNPYDDLLRNLARLIEQLTTLDQRLQTGGNRQSEKSPIFGCAIIAGTGFPEGFGESCGKSCRSSQEVPYELSDTGEMVYLTIEMSIAGGEEPEVFFTRETCEISSTGTTGKIHLPFPIEPEKCNWSYRNGILDAVLIKETEPVQIIQETDPDQDITSLS